jgi:hypothetical protein
MGQNSEQIERFEEYRKCHSYLSSIPNLKLNFGPVENPGDHPLEQVYMSNIFKLLTEWRYFNEYDFFILSSKQSYDFKFDHKSVVFCLSNEDHKIPDDMLNAGIIFSPYCPFPEQCPPNCFPIPLGYNGSMIELPLKAMKDREYSVFFSGNIHRKRVPFFIFSKIHQMLISIFNPALKRNEKLQFHRKFTGGFDPRTYSEILMDTKISLVPEGYLSDISFRFFEAAKSGCIIITKRLYDFWYFKDFPGIELNSWYGLHREIKRLLRNPEHLKELHLEMLNYYKKNCSEEAVSKYIIGELNETRENQ